MKKYRIRVCPTIVPGNAWYYPQVRFLFMFWSTLDSTPSESVARKVISWHHQKGNVHYLEVTP